MIVAGFGCRGGAIDASLIAALKAALTVALDGEQTGYNLSGLATLRGKAPLLAPIADSLDLPVILIDPELVAGIVTPTRSPASLAAYGTGSVAEAVALAAAGQSARLLVRRIVSPDRQATCAIAQGSPG